MFETIAQAHAYPLPLSDEAMARRDASILMRYDGMRGPDGPIVYAVILASDIAKLPEDILQSLPMAHRDDSGRLKASRHAFFMEGPVGLSFYVDTDEHEDFVLMLQDVALDAGLGIEKAVGDLSLLCDDAMDLAPPRAPAFHENGLMHVPVSRAMQAIAEHRAALEVRGLGPAHRGAPDGGLHS